MRLPKLLIMKGEPEEADSPSEGNVSSLVLALYLGLISRELDRRRGRPGQEEQKEGTETRCWITKALDWLNQQKIREIQVPIQVFDYVGCLGEELGEGEYSFHEHVYRNHIV